MSATVIRYAESEVPTEYGSVRTLVYRVGDAQPPEEHIALVIGAIDQGAARAGEGADESAVAVPVRVHSECWTGEVLRSKKCDCREQLDFAMRHIAAEGRGAVVYLRQEGRGIGLGNKVRAYALQAEGADTVDANRMLGFADDERTYEVAAAILKDLGVSRVALMTNNPKKVDGLREHGIDVVTRIAVVAEPNEHNADYLAVKAKKMGHEL